MTRHRNIPASLFGAVRTALVLGVLLVTAGCAERHLQNAQESFSKGAAIENLAVLGDPNKLADANKPTGAILSGPQAAPLTGGAVIYYTDARENVRKALDREKSALDKQKLTGSAYALMALVSWRLDDLQGSTSGGEANPCDSQNYRGCAVSSSDEATRLFGDDSYLKRDRFTMIILPGLLDHSRGLRNTDAGKPMIASDNFKSAFQNIGRGLAEPASPISGAPLTTEQSLRIYALLAQFQVLRAWSAALTQAALPSTSSEQSLTVAQRNSCNSLLRHRWAPEVASNLEAFDPNRVAVPENLRRAFLNAIGNPTPITQPPCPWPI